MLVQLLTIVILALTLSLDALAVSFSYGCNKIKIPLSSICLISIICTGILGVAFLFGSFIAPFIPEWIAMGLSFSILLIIGIVKLLDSITKSIIRKHADINKEVKLSIFNFKFILRLYADPEAADVDVSRVLDHREAVLLAIPLSLDGFAVGFGAALLSFDNWIITFFIFIALSIAANGVSLWLGGIIGNKIAQKMPFNISWLAGAILIILAVLQLI